MNKKPSSGIYIIINTALRKVYIGQSVDVHRRLEQHFQELQKGTHPNKDMQRDYCLMKDAFSARILKTCYPAQLNYYEKEYIKQYSSNDERHGYNHTKGGGKRKHKRNGRFTDLLDELTEL